MHIDRAVIEVNGGCNYTCKMCPQTKPDGKTGARGKKWLTKMPLDVFEDLVVQMQPNVVNLEGSGEATLNRDLPKYIEIVKKHGAKAYIFSNGSKMHGQFMRDCVGAGLDFFRFSIIGYDQATYQQWMNASNFDSVCENMYEMREHASGTCQVASYHLILNNDQVDYERDRYLEVSRGGPVEIWKMHNWAGGYESDRSGSKRTCGRPFSPDAVIRANGAVHPCCQVLGKDDEATLGSIYDNPFHEIWNGAAYSNLRERHTAGDYPSFCKDCDFLIDDPEVLVHSNYAETNVMNGASFTLSDFQGGL